jgi:hypothetical protein
VFIDARGIGWDDAFEGDGLPPDPATSVTGGFVEFTRIAAVCISDKHGAEAVALQLHDGTVHALPSRVTRRTHRHEMIELLTDAFPEVALSEPKTARPRK